MKITFAMSDVESATALV